LQGKLSASEQSPQKKAGRAFARPIHFGTAISFSENCRCSRFTMSGGSRMQAGTRIK